MSIALEAGSFRDPSGFVFRRNGELFRQVQPDYRPNYDQLIGSGLYQKLKDQGLLVAHEERQDDPQIEAGAYRVLKPEVVPFVSHPYEWCFGQLQDAALATLAILKTALTFGMTLKDASAYNIQFAGSRPVLIDTLSFERYEEGRPWTAYGQFCRHFLAPLALMSRVDVRLGALLRSNIDGVPLDLASRLLPPKTRLSPGLLAHIHLHAASSKKFERRPVNLSEAKGRIGKTAMLGLVDNLESTVRGLSWKPAGTEWGDYYSATNYTGEAMSAKERIVSEMLEAISPAPRTAWDFGANTGVFSRLASKRGAYTVAWDIDPAAVEKNYVQCKADGETNLLPLILDLANPSPDLGWELGERASVIRRGPADVLLALALVHHLAIGNNVPLERVARFFRSCTNWAIVEFVPKSDSQVQRLLASRADVFPNYTTEGFLEAFSGAFETVKQVPVPESDRSVYLFRGRGTA